MTVSDKKFRIRIFWGNDIDKVTKMLNEWLDELDCENIIDIKFSNVGTADLPLLIAMVIFKTLRTNNKD